MFGQCFQAHTGILGVSWAGPGVGHGDHDGPLELSVFYDSGIL